MCICVFVSLCVCVWIATTTTACCLAWCHHKVAHYPTQQQASPHMLGANQHINAHDKCNDMNDAARVNTWVVLSVLEMRPAIGCKVMSDR